MEDLQLNMLLSMKVCSNFDSSGNFLEINTNNRLLWFLIYVSWSGISRIPSSMIHSYRIDNKTGPNKGMILCVFFVLFFFTFTKLLRMQKSISTVQWYFSEMSNLRFYCVTFKHSLHCSYLHLSQSKPRSWVKISSNFIKFNIKNTEKWILTLAMAFMYNWNLVLKFSKMF